jgi:hypothetical protein
MRLEHIVKKRSFERDKVNAIFLINKFFLRAVGDWPLAIGCWRLAVGGFQIHHS